MAAGTYAMAYYLNSMQLQTASNGADEVNRRGADTANGDTRNSIDPLNEERRATGTTAFDATVLIRDATGNVLSAAQSTLNRPEFRGDAGAWVQAAMIGAP